MSNQNQPSQWVPEIMYEESEGGVSSHIPFIMVPEDQAMPDLLYVFESRETGEHEPGQDGEDLPVVQWDLHQYADMSVLKTNLSHVEYDNVRFALGLQPLEAAAVEGSRITDSIRKKLDSE